MICYKNFDLQFVYGPSIFFQHNLKLSIVTLNIFINLTLFKVIFLTNFTCLGKRLILFIFLNGSYLWSMLDTVLSFPFFRTILKNSTSSVSFFTRFLCIFAIFNIIVLNFAKRTSFPKPAMVCLMFLFWLLVLLGLSITGFVINIVFTLILGLIFITFTFKLYIFIIVIIQNFTIFFRNVLYILFRILSIFYCFVFFPIIMLICIFGNLLHDFRNIANLLYILPSWSVSVNVDVDITHIVRQESNITSLKLWIIFPVTFLFLVLSCKQKSDKK